MSADGKVIIETELDDKGAKSGMSKLGGTLGKLGSSIGGLGASALKGTAVAIAGVSTAIVGLGASAVNYNASMEQYATSFEVMTGSAEKSEEVMNRLKELGAKTPFEFEDLAKSTQTLMAFGFTADEAIEQFSMLGDISQGDAQKLDTFSNSLGKMQSSGKVTLESLNMMIEGGFNPLQVISQKTGESMESLYDRVSKGTVSLDEIKGAMVTATSEGGQFYQSMDKQSQTLNGRISTLKDNFQQFTGALFSGASSGAGSVIDMAIGWVSELQTAFEQNGVEGLASSIGNVLGDAIGLLVENLPDLVGLATTIISNLISSLSLTMYAQKDNIAQLIFILIDSLGNTSVDLIGFGISLVTSMLIGMQSQMPNIIASVTNVLTSLMTMLTENLPFILQAGINIITELALGLAQALPTLIPQAVNMILTLVMGLLDNIDKIIDAGLQLIIGLITGLINALPMLIEKAPEIIAKLTVALINAVPKIAEASLQLIIALSKALFTSLPTLLSQIPNLVMQIVKAFINMRNSFAGIGTNIVNTIRDTISNAWSSLVSKASSWGSDLIQGLANGILSKISTITSAIKNVAEVIKSYIHFSVPDVGPLTEYESWMPDMMDGLAKGINGSKSVVKKSLNSLAQDMADSFSDIDPLSQLKSTMVNGVNSMQMGINSYVNGNIGGSYNGLADSIVTAIANSNMTIKVDKYEMGRIVRTYV